MPTATAMVIPCSVCPALYGSFSALCSPVPVVEVNFPILNDPIWALVTVVLIGHHYSYTMWQPLPTFFYNAQGTFRPSTPTYRIRVALYNATLHLPTGFLLSQNYCLALLSCGFVTEASKTH